ncbi:MAG TPA: monofunctional biosynthetic peptidoglycan transglycosylase [Chitinophaga sp.]
MRLVLFILIVGQWVYLILLKWVHPPFTITMLNNRLHLSGDKTFKYVWVDYDHISQFAKLAVIAKEDQLFTDHDGFDFKSIEKAMKHNQQSKKIHGASTISQQVAKNVFLWQHGGWFRKGLEVYFTFMIEKLWGKQRILEMYLNVAQTGDGIYGMEAAAQTYYHIPAANLTREEAAMIAGCLSNPVKFTVVPPARITIWYQKHTLTQMRYLASDPDIAALVAGRK